MSYSHKILVIIFIVTLLYTLPAVAGDWPLGWSEITELNPVSINSSIYGVDLDGEGKLYLSWVEGRHLSTKVYYRHLKPGSEPGEPVLLAEGPSFSNSHLLVDSRGLIHLFWEGKKGNKEAVYYALVDGEGNKELGPITLVESRYLLRDIEPVLSPDGYLYLFWSGRDPDTMSFNVNYQVMDLQGEMILGPKILTDSNEISGRNTALVTKERIDLFWTDYHHNTYTYYFRSFTREGKPIDDRLLIDTAGNLESRDKPQMVEEKDETGRRIHLLWKGQSSGGGFVAARDILYYGRIGEQGLDLSGQQLVEGEVIQRPNLQLIEGNKLALAWQDNREGALQTHYIELDGEGTRLTDPLCLDITRRASHAPRIVIDHQGYSHVLWLAFDEEGRNYLLSMINNRFPAQPSFWYSMGLDHSQPLLHLIIVLSASFFVSLIMTGIHIWVIALAMLVLFIADRFSLLPVTRRGFLSVSLFLFSLLFLLQGLPRIIEPGAGFFYHLFTALVASVLTVVFCRWHRNFSFSGIYRLATIVLWLFWHNYFLYLQRIIEWF